MQRQVPELDEQTLKSMDQAILGEGITSTVHLGKWQGTTVAIKKMMINPSQPQDHLEVIEYEKNIMAEISHPNIVNLCAFAKTDDYYYLALEYVSLGSFGDFIYDDTGCYQPFSYSVVYKIMSDISKALAYLHATGILHRDLKCDNILLEGTKQGNHVFVGEAKLGDFGWARQKDKSDGMRAGTPSFMAPETIERGDTSERSEVFNFGMTLCEGMMWNMPFADKTNEETKHLIANGERPIIPSQCPPKIQSIIKCCWNQDPEKRPTADAVQKWFSTDMNDNVGQTVQKTQSDSASLQMQIMKQINDEFEFIALKKGGTQDYQALKTILEANKQADEIIPDIIKAMIKFLCERFVKHDKRILLFDTNKKLDPIKWLNAEKWTHHLMRDVGSVLKTLIENEAFNVFIKEKYDIDIQKKLDESFNKSFAALKQSNDIEGELTVKLQEIKLS